MFFRPVALGLLGVSWERWTAAGLPAPLGHEVGLSALEMQLPWQHRGPREKVVGPKSQHRESGFRFTPLVSLWTGVPLRVSILKEGILYVVFILVCPVSSLVPETWLIKKKKGVPTVAQQK